MDSAFPLAVLGMVIGMLSDRDRLRKRRNSATEGRDQRPDADSLPDTEPARSVSESYRTNAAGRRRPRRVESEARLGAVEGVGDRRSETREGQDLMEDSLVSNRDGVPEEASDA